MKRSKLLRALIASFALLAFVVANRPSSATAASNGNSADAASVERAAAIAEPSVVYIETYWHGYVNTGNAFGYLGPYDVAMRGSGFIVSGDGSIATAGHMVDPGIDGILPTMMSYAVNDLVDRGVISETDAPSVYGYGVSNWKVEGEVAGSPPDRTVYVQHGAAVAGLKTGQAWPARVIEFKPLNEGDVALLKVEADNLPVLQVTQDRDVAIGTDVLSIGYPGSSDEVTDATYQPTFKDGKVNSQKTRENGLLPVYETSAALSGGMSGGPTVDLNGNVVGVNSFTIDGETQAFNFLSPASLVREQLTRNNVDNALGAVDTSYRAGLDAYFAGHYASAITDFRQVLDRVPSHQMAQEYLGRALDKKPTDSGGGLPTGLIAGGGGLVLVLAGLVVIVVVRRRRKTAGTASAPVAGRPAPIGRVSLSAPPPPWPPAEDVPTGTEATTVPDSVQFCSECGTHVVDDEHFCPKCGHLVHATPMKH
jgi:S1-C subfamily serine protease